MSLNLDCVVKINHGIHFLIWAFYAMCIDEISVFLQAVGANIQSFVLSFTVPEEVALSYIFHPRDIKRKGLNIYVLQIYSVKIMKGKFFFAAFVIYVVPSIIPFLAYVIYVSFSLSLLLPYPN